MVREDFKGGSAGRTKVAVIRTAAVENMGSATLGAIIGVRGAWAANLARHSAQRCQVDLGGNDINFTSLEADAIQLTITRWKSMLDAIRHARINNR